MLLDYCHHKTQAAFAVMAALIAVTGCSNNRQDAAARASDSVSMAAPAADSTTGMAGVQLNDAKIADIAVTANSLDSAAGALALKQAQSKAVKDFAQTMIHDHSAANRKAEQLATELNLSPEGNKVSDQLKDEADNATSDLKDLKGAAFDRAYMDHEIAVHTSVLASLDNTLIPGAGNAELKQFLSSIRPTIAGHLARAKSVRKDLGGTDSPSARDSARMP